MSEKEEISLPVVDEQAIVEPTYTGQEITKANAKMAKIAPQIRAIKAMETVEPVDVTKTLYPDWETMTKKEFEGKQWYVEEKLIPLVERDSKEVYHELLEQERVSGMSVEEAEESFSW